MYEKTIKEILNGVARKKYVLPAIQREFVWSPDQIFMLFDSVMQGYPFGEFLFWRIDSERSEEYRYYDFILNYHQRDNPHCPEIGELPNQEIVAVLDGQQRMTAFNIGLRGSMAVKLPYKRQTNPDAYPRRVLALDLLTRNERDEEGNCYTFDFIDEEDIGRQDEHLWFRISDILRMERGPDMNDWLSYQDLGNQQQRDAFRVLDCLHRVIHTERTVTYYEENNQDIEHVLNIFIRRNRGGTTLSYSDLLLSIATSQWGTRDARKEVHQLVGDLNRIGSGLELTKDFVLKAGLMLTDISSVGFQVRNFTHENMARLEQNWGQIRDALVGTVRLVTGFGFDAKTVRAASALLPIAYYLYSIDSPSNFDSHSQYERNRQAIRGWLIRSILKASGIWGSGLDTLLTDLRDVIQSSEDSNFPAEKMRRRMIQRGKSLEFTEEEIDDLADMGSKDRRVFALLALLFSFIDFRHHQFHVDHVFPKARFTSSRLCRDGFDDDEIDTLMDRVDCLANLQLLEGLHNQEKRDALPAKWLGDHYPDENARLLYCEQHLLGDVPDDMAGFLEFYEARRERMRSRIAELVNSV